MAIPEPGLADLLADGLVARPDVDALERMSFAGRDAIVYRFTQTPETRGFSGRDGDGPRTTSVAGLGFAIRPVRMTIEEMKP